MAKGNKNNVDQVLSEFIRGMANETVEDGGKTRAEILAEIVWKFALGWVEDCGEGKTKIWPPAKWAIDLVYERAEGRPAQVGDSGNKKVDVSERIGQKTIDRLNKLAEVSGERSPKQGTATRPAPPKRLVPPNPGSVGGPNHGDQGSQTGPRSSSLLAKDTS
jgi:hypothetical protein